MIIYLVGISCVGKTTIGEILAREIGFKFFDLDQEVENYYNKAIERLQIESFAMNGFRKKASIVLDNLFDKNSNAVISGTPSGLKYSYWQVYKKHIKDKALYSVHLHDSFDNILKRLTFYDIDSNPINIELDSSKQKFYLRSLREDYNFFKDSYKRADFKIDISGIPLKSIPKEIINEMTNLQFNKQSVAIEISPAQND